MEALTTDLRRKRAAYAAQLEEAVNRLVAVLSAIPEVERVIYAQGEEVVLGHSVERLCDAAAAFDPAFGRKLATWSVLDGYYVPTRYPNTVPDSIRARVYTKGAARDAVWTCPDGRPGRFGPRVGR